MIQPERKKMEDKWKILTKQALQKLTSFKEPIGFFKKILMAYLKNF